MRLDLTVLQLNGQQRDLRVDVAPDTPADDVLTELLHRCGFNGDEPVALTSGHRINRTTSISKCGLRSGAILTTSAVRATRAAAQLCVINGPDAGRAEELRPVMLVGRDDACDLRLTDPEASRRHAALESHRTGIVIRDLDSTNGTMLGIDPVERVGVGVGEHDIIRIGDSLLQIRNELPSRASVRVTEDGTWLVNPAPREFAVLAPAPIDVPEPPVARGRQDGRWLATGAPAMLGVAMAVLMRSPMFLAFALLSPLALFITAGVERAQSRREGTLGRSAFRESAERAAAQVEAALAHEALQRRRRAPDPALISETATAAGHRLWERRRGDDDLLSLRIGCAPQSSETQVRCAGITSSAGSIDALPFAVDLGDGPFGLAGPVSLVQGIARSLIAQLTVLTSPSDVQIVALLADGHDWRWLRWIPHVRGNLAFDGESRAASVTELQRTIDDRRDDRRDGENRWRGTWTVVLVDRPSELELPGLAALLAKGAALGISAICIDRAVAQLPAGCTTVLTPDGSSGSRIAVRTARQSAAAIVADQVSVEWADQIARAIAPFDVDERADDRLPDSCELLELHDASLDVEDVLLRWKRSTPAPTAVLGLGSGGAVEVDLVRDGPHTLVAGTTGAGKSELLRSWIASLALEHPPEDVAFVLVDYKGGAAFAECELLPHTTGLVTDLDPHLVRRVLISLGAELRRRETLFAARGVSRMERLPRRSRLEAGATATRRRCRRIRCSCRRAARVHHGVGLTRPARAIAGDSPDPGHPEAQRRGLRRDPREYRAAYRVEDDLGAGFARHSELPRGEPDRRCRSGTWLLTRRTAVDRLSVGVCRRARHQASRGRPDPGFGSMASPDPRCQCGCRGRSDATFAGGCRSARSSASVWTPRHPPGVVASAAERGGAPVATGEPRLRDRGRRSACTAKAGFARAQP